jgi:hypothetical protein
MTRARSVFAATLLGAGLISVTAFAQSAPQAPPMTSVLAGKKFTPPAQGAVEINFTKPVTKKEKDMVITKIQVKNIMTKPIARLTITETWYGKDGSTVAGGKGVINGLLQPGEIQTVTIETPYNAKMSANNWNFSHANGTVPKPHKVEKLVPGDAKDVESAPAKAAPAKAPAKKK